MGFFGTSKGASNIDREQSLKTIPVVNTMLEIEDEESEKLTLRVPFKPSRWWKALGYVGKLPTHKRISLDRLGSEVFKLCDGQRRAEEIIRTFAKRHKLNLREAELSCVEYLKTLAKRGIIVLAVPRKEADNQASAASGEQRPKRRRKKRRR